MALFHDYAVNSSFKSKLLRCEQFEMLLMQNLLGCLPQRKPNTPGGK